MSCMSYIHVPWYVCHVMYVCHVCTYMMYEGTNGCCTSSTTVCMSCMYVCMYDVCMYVMYVYTCMYVVCIPGIRMYRRYVLLWYA